MTLSVGSRLGPYEILAPIGAGGMGEVYRARDTRLDRTVAVKVLPSHLSTAPEVRQRFEREAKTISQLSHPHICALYDVGHQDGTDFLVMEYLEGETLSDRLGRGALPLDQTLRFGVQIADALDKAHRQGIVHRDLKPGNVMLTRSGVKLLDFGLAKAMEAQDAQPGMTSFPTVAGSAPLTQEGTILGTFQYMAPEQLEGREADARTDIFAFGCVLYEMTTGKKAFSGTSQASLISAIMSSEPASPSTLQPLTPPALERIVTTCLAKDPEDRWQSARDVARELQWISGLDSSARGAVSAAPRRRRRFGWVAAGIASAAALVLAALLARRPPASAPAPALRAAWTSPDGARFDLLSGPMAVSPDGTRVAFVGRESGGRTLLFVRSLDSEVSQVLAGTEDASYPFWSPDGRTIGFSTGNTLSIVSAAGGPPEKLTSVIRARSATWSAQGDILFSRGGLLGLNQISLSDRKLREGTTLARDELSHVAPQFLPDGRHYLYLARRLDRVANKLESEIWVGLLGSSERKLVLRADSNAIYVSPGYLLFRQDENLVARPFDAKSLTLSGDPITLARGIAWADETLTGLFSASETGLLAWAAGGVLGLSQLSLFDLAGKRLEVLVEPGDFWTPRLSHDGRRVVVESMDRTSGNRDIWIYDLARRSTPVHWTFDPGDEATPVWSPDDTLIAYSSRQGTDPTKPDKWSVVVKSVRGEEPETRLLSVDPPAYGYLTDWSPDGALLALNRPNPETRNDIWVISARDRSVRKILQTKAEDRDAVFSPDGRWMAYMSSESGRWEVYVRAFPGPGGAGRSQLAADTSRAGSPMEKRFSTCRSTAASCTFPSGRAPGSRRTRPSRSSPLRCGAR